MSRFSGEVFCRKVLKSFVEEAFCALFHNVSDREKVHASEEKKYQKVSLKTFCHTVPKQLVEEPFSVSLILSIENVLVERVSSHSSIESCCLAVQKTRTGNF